MQSEGKGVLPRCDPCVSQHRQAKCPPKDSGRQETCWTDRSGEPNLSAYHRASVLLAWLSRGAAARSQLERILGLVPGPAASHHDDHLGAPGRGRRARPRDGTS
jgi:hypothetical protein